MKRFIAPVVLLIAAMSQIALHCQDFGVTIENVSAVETEANVIYTQTDKLGIWFNAKTDSLELKLQVSYWISFANLNFVYPNLPDIDYLYLSYRFRSDDMGPSLHSAKLGRFRVSDSSGYVLDDPLDGALLSYAFPSFTISLYGGFSGLIWNPDTSTIDMTLADNDDKTEPDGYFLGPPRIIEMLSIIIPEIFPFHTLTFTLIGQEDMRNPASLTQEGDAVYAENKGGTLHSAYCGIGIDGSISSTMYYNLFGYFETGSTLSFISDYGYKPIIAGLLGFNFLAYFEQALSSRVEISGVFSTGDPDYTIFREGNGSDIASMFVPISNKISGVAFSPGLGNLLFFTASYSLKPFLQAKGTTLEKLQTLVRLLFFFRSGKGPVSGVAINEGSSSLYLGTEGDLVINYRPASDLGISLSAGFFLADMGPTSAIVNDGKPFKFSGKLEFSMSM